MNGASQASKYNKTCKALIIYFGLKHDQRIYRAFEHKDADVGRRTLVKPKPPMVDKVVQEATLYKQSVMKGVHKMVIDTYGEDCMIYQINLAVPQ